MRLKFGYLNMIGISHKILIKKNYNIIQIHNNAMRDWKYSI